MGRQVGLVAAVGCLLLGCLVAAGPGAAARALDPLAGAPVTGQCFDLDAADVASATVTDPAVDCAATHTAQTVAVDLLPATMTYDARALEVHALSACSRARAAALGTTRLRARLTAYGFAWFVPTPEQQAAGARWVRCDLLLGDPADPQPLPAPDALAVGDPPYASAVARCLAGPAYVVTPCTQRHSHRATAVVRVRGARYPGERARQRLGDARCRDLVDSRRFRHGWPDRAAWQAGERGLVCYSHSRTRR